jgi:hypothetical protein
MFQRDYILRLIDAVAQAVARALKLLIQEQKPDEAEQVIAEGYAALSLDRELLLLLDGPSLRVHCGGDDKLVLAVQLLLADCQIQVHKGDARTAQRTLKAARRALAELEEKPTELTAELERLEPIVMGLGGRSAAPR